MDIIRFTTGSGGAPGAVGSADGEVVAELGAATVAELLRQPVAEIRRRCEEAYRRTAALTCSPTSRR